jgi:hypothetical protein
MAVEVYFTHSFISRNNSESEVTSCEPDILCSITSEGRYFRLRYQVQRDLSQLLRIDTNIILDFLPFMPQRGRRYWLRVVKFALERIMASEVGMLVLSHIPRVSAQSV